MSNCRNTRKMPCYNIREVAPRGPPQLAASAAPASAWRASVPRDRAARTVVAVDAPPRAERTSESARLSTRPQRAPWTVHPPWPVRGFTLALDEWINRSCVVRGVY